VYLARFEVGSQVWVQGAVHLPYARDAFNATWREHLRTIVSYFERAPSVRTSYRVFVTPQSFRRVIFVSAEEENELELRGLLARFERLAPIDEQSIELPPARDSYDCLANTFPSLRCLIAFGDYRVKGGPWLAADFHVWPSLAEFSAEAATLGYSFAYHANLEPMRPDPARLKSIARNLLSVEHLPAAPPALVESQQRIARRAGDATHVVDELLGTDSAEAAEWLSARLHRMFREQFEGQRLDAPQFSFDQSPYESSLIAMRHRVVFDDLTPAETASLAITTEEWLSLIAFTPPERFHAHRAASPSTPDDELEGDVGETTRRPPPYIGNDDYFFISYKRRDMPRIVPILERIVASGYRIWYDKGIPGGSEWDAEIEERIQRCRAVVLFATQAAVDSRYVRREVKFADALQKPLVTVKVEEAALGGGMNMLLSQYQMVDAAIGDFADELQRALQYVLSR